MKDSARTRAIARIEQLARHDPGGRGLAARAPEGELLPAAIDLLSGTRTLIATGFCIRRAAVGETDGPPGALALAAALHRLGQSVALVTDRYSADLLSAGAHAGGSAWPIHVLSLPQAVADGEIERLSADLAPTHVVAIERPGTAADGHRYSMRGEILDDQVPGMERLFDRSGGSACRTLAIGDGGNELGMGALRASLRDCVPLGERIFATAPADHAIVAGISNWGAYALVAALSVLTGELLMRTPEEERVILEAIVAAGGVDGMSSERVLRVDGLPWDAYGATLAAIHAEAVLALQG
jgi:hypothetical protein